MKTLKIKILANNEFISWNLDQPKCAYGDTINNAIEDTFLDGHRAAEYVLDESGVDYDIEIISDHRACELAANGHAGAIVIGSHAVVEEEDESGDWCTTGEALTKEELDLVGRADVAMWSVLNAAINEEALIDNLSALKNAVNEADVDALIEEGKITLKRPEPGKLNITGEPEHFDAMCKLLDASNKDALFDNEEVFIDII